MSCEFSIITTGVDNIKVDLREMGCEGMNWIHLP
jgi:hypothetical protein